MIIKETKRMIELLKFLHVYNLSFVILNPEKDRPILKLLEKNIILTTSNIKEFFSAIRIILNSNIKRNFCYRVNFNYNDMYWEKTHYFYSKEDKNIWMFEFINILEDIYKFTGGNKFVCD